MTGDSKRRFCEHCQLHVHNLSVMTNAERKQLLSNVRERICVAYEQKPDAVIVGRGLWLFLERLLRPWRALAAVWAVIIALFTSSCATKCEPTPPAPNEAHKEMVAGRVAPKSQSDGKLMLVGAMPYRRPLWQRILYFWEW